MRDAVLDAEQLDVAAVRAEVGPHAVERVADALLDAHRVHAVQQQQMLHELVAHERLRLLRSHRDSHFQLAQLKVAWH